LKHINLLLLSRTLRTFGTKVFQKSGRYNKVAVKGMIWQ